MSTAPEGADRQQMKVTEFMRLLPLTLELAGLPKSPEGGSHYNEGQLEARATTIRQAYAAARQLLREIASS